MASLSRAAAAIATILVREGVDYAQSKAVFKVARERAGLHASPACRSSVDRLSVEEELGVLDHAYTQNGRMGLMLQTFTDAAPLAPVSSVIWSRIRTHMAYLG